MKQAVHIWEICQLLVSVTGSILQLTIVVNNIDTLLFKLNSSSLFALPGPTQNALKQNADRFRDKAKHFASPFFSPKDLNYLPKIIETVALLYNILSPEQAGQALNNIKNNFIALEHTLEELLKEGSSLYNRIYSFIFHYPQQGYNSINNELQTNSTASMSISFFTYSFIKSSGNNKKNNNGLVNFWVTICKSIFSLADNLHALKSLTKQIHTLFSYSQSNLYIMSEITKKTNDFINRTNQYLALFIPQNPNHLVNLMAKYASLCNNELFIKDPNKLNQIISDYKSLEEQTTQLIILGDDLYMQLDKINKTQTTQSAPYPPQSETSFFSTIPPSEEPKFVNHLLTLFTPSYSGSQKYYTL